MIHACACGRWLHTGAYERGHRRCATCRKYGRKAHRLWTTRELRTLREFSHLPRREIAERLGRPTEQVAYAAKRYGIKLTAPPPGRWPEATVRRCVSLRKRGATSREISESTGIPLLTIRTWIKRGKLRTQQEAA